MRVSFDGSFVSACQKYCGSARSDKIEIMRSVSREDFKSFNEETTNFVILQGSKSKES